MSHHFDTPTAQEDPRINVCDFYLFRGRPGFTVMAMTVNPDAGISGPDTFRDEGLYAFRFDLNNDAREELTFKFRFSAPTHAEGDEHRHVQTFELRRATGAAALKGADGELLLSGRTGEIAQGAHGVMVYAGLAPDLFAGDAAALGAFRNALFKDNKFDPAAFQNHKNFFARRNVTAIVLEVPSHSIGRGHVHAWATASLYGHAPEVQVSRWGLPLITNIFMPDLGMREDFNRAGPHEDLKRFAPQIGQVAEKVTALASSASSPADYAKQLVARLCPTTLPYELDTAAAFDFAGFNGRGLTDDAMDVMLTLTTNTALGDGVAPDPTRTKAEFPYFGVPYTAAEQADVTPARPPAKK
ncbi:MAG TPA: DUF4331 family protein [Aliidongia sp.]|uniref:DUF4331 family protein n=1 Tax=Aliidongia sp. TaxID=1914230 RepID=UPI002DDD5CBA|nr:DUF4331 family protein [Aliidongia sp.]HEV2673017.1 DUF4331 family protein [Aliidongia sp.]